MAILTNFSSLAKGVHHEGQGTQAGQAKEEWFSLESVSWNESVVREDGHVPERNSFPSFFICE
jgi:hypothetical protein